MTRIRTAAGDTPAIVSIALDAIAPQRWRNGAGTTRELLRWPPGEHWQWRISVANIDADAPFSAYPGVKRWFTVIDGLGVALGFAGRPEAILTPGSYPLYFDGGDAPGCRLTGGPTRDLNLMLRGVPGGIERVDGPAPWRVRGTQCGLFSAAAGRLHLPEGNVRQVAAMSLSWFSAPPAGTLRFTALDEGHPAPGSASGRNAEAAAWWLFVGQPLG